MYHFILNNPLFVRIFFTYIILCEPFAHFFATAKWPSQAATWVVRVTSLEELFCLFPASDELGGKP